MKKRYLLLFCLFVGLNSIAVSQDTIVIKTEEKFSEIVRNSFFDYVISMNKDIRNQIDSALKKYDFEHEIAPCEKMLHFSIILDSCGFIIGCKPSNNNKNIEGIDDFEQEVISIVMNSNWQVKTKYKSDNVINDILMDESDLRSFRFSFAFLCEPLEVEYFEYVNIIEDKVFVYYSYTGPIYFSGYKKNC